MRHGGEPGGGVQLRAPSGGDQLARIDDQLPVKLVPAPPAAKHGKAETNEPRRRFEQQRRLA